MPLSFVATIINTHAFSSSDFQGTFNFCPRALENTLETLMPSERGPHAHKQFFF